MALVKPTKSITINDFKNILKCKMHAYLAYGTLADGEIPTTLAELGTLQSTYFSALGDLSKDPIEYGWARETEELHAGKKRGLLNIVGSIKCANVGKDMIDLLDEAGMDGDCTILFVPFKNPTSPSALNPAKAVIVRGVSIVDNGKGNGNNKYGEVVLEFNAQPDKIGDSIKILTLTS
ncbi:MAG: hypothetical protein WCQ59_08705 [Candidatus Cloacimonadaceae bacterium]|jgi:hypothetical protein